MMRVPPLRRRHEFGDVGFYRARRRTQREPEPVRNAEHVCVDGKRRFFKCHRHHDVRGLPAHAGQRFELLALARNLARVIVDETLRGSDDIFRFHPEEAARFDDRFDVFLLRFGEGRRRRIVREEKRRR